LLGLDQQAAEGAEQGYFLRNNFGAHAGGWRWWDQVELTEELAPQMAELSLHAIR
jgi:hypothetical protein